MRGETLEERCVPARFKWVNSVFDSTNHWTVTRNWEESRGGVWSNPDDGNYPGANGRTDDEVEFFVNSSVRDTQCVMNVPITLKSMKVQELFNSYIELQHTLTITDGKLLLDAGDATFKGDGTKQQVRLTGSTTFEWWSGTLWNLQMIVGAGAKIDLPVRDPVGPENPYLCMAGTNIDVESGGAIDWKWRDVRTAMAVGVSPGVTTANLVHVYAGATFNITARNQTWGSTNPDQLEVRNRGHLTVLDSYRATIVGQLNNQEAGRILVSSGRLEVTGPVVQSGAGATFKIARDAYLYPHNTAGVLDILDGTLEGGGTVEGSVCVYGDGELNPSGPAALPGGGQATFTITCILHMYGGRLVTDIYDRDKYDVVSVGGQAVLGGRAVGQFQGGVLNRDFRPGDRITFLTYDSRDGDFTAFTTPDGWSPDKNNKQYWFRQGGAVGGKALADANGNGVFDAWAGEQPLGGVPVALLDADDEVVATTETAADGSYLFDEVGFADWTVKFIRPEELRPVLAGATYDEYSDSDYAFDYSLDTALTPVSLSEMSPYVWNTADALFRPLVAVPDAHTTAYRTAVGGTVLGNDPPADGDTLTVTVHPDHQPAGGTLVLDPDGTFTYTPDPGFWGTDSFVYVVEDSFDHAATATVTITVIPPPATVSGRVWRDDDADGIQDTNETDTSYGWVALFDENDVMVAQMPVEGDGTFAFTVPAGTYRLYVSQASFNPSPQDQGEDDIVDSDVDANGSSGWFALAPDEAIDLDVGMVYFV